LTDELPDVRRRLGVVEDPLLIVPGRVPVTDDGRAGKERVAGGVVGDAVGVDHEPDRLSAEGGDGRQGGAGGGPGGQGVDDHEAVAGRDHGHGLVEVVVGDRQQAIRDLSGMHGGDLRCSIGYDAGVFYLSRPLADANDGSG